MLKKQVLQNIIGTSIYLGTQWFMLLFVVRMLDFSYAGMFSLAITITSLFYIISYFGLRPFQVSDINTEYDDFNYFIVRMLTTSVGLLICVLFIIFTKYSNIQKKIIILFMVYKSFESISELVYGYYQNDKRFDYICISLSIKGLFQLGAFWLGLFLFTNIIHALIFLSLSIFITISFYDIPRIKTHIISFYILTKNNILKSLKLLKNCSPMLLILLSAPLLQAIPRIFYENKYSQELFGKFSSVAAPTVIFTVIISSALTPFFPRFAEYYNNDKIKMLKLLFKTILITLVLGILALIVCIFFGEQLLVFLYGDEIRSFSYVLNGIVITTILTSILTCFTTFFISSRKLISLSITLILGCLLCYFITPYFINNYQMNGIAYSMIFIQTIQVLAVSILSYRMCLIDINK